VKASAILIYVKTPLRMLPDPIRDVLRQLPTEWIVGMDAKHHKRWLRLWRDFDRCEPGEAHQLYRAQERSGPYHRMHRKVLERLFESQDEYDEVDAVHDWFKFKCYFVKWEEGPITGRPIPQPRSTNFDECSEDEIREFHNRMIDRLYEPDTQEHFWPRKSPAERNATVEDVLHRQDPDEPPPTRSTARRPMTRSRNRRQHEEHA
jgi:hypothetical protein